MEVKDDETYDIPDLNIYLELDKVFIYHLQVGYT